MEVRLTVPVVKQSSVRSEIFVELPPKPISSPVGAAYSAPSGA